MGQIASAGIHRLLAIAILALLVYGVMPASPQAPLEHHVKAAFLLNFIKFVEWPPDEFPDADSPISICIVGEDPFGPAIDEIVEGEVVGSRKLTVHRVAAPQPKECQVVFIGRSDKDSAKALAGVGPGVLTVGEGESFLRGGGIIAFVIENRRVRFNVNQTAARNAKLRLSSKLLSVAKVVEK